MEESSYDVVVVGAGASGLAAASTLQQDGWKVLVLEASDRVGGRVRSDNHLGFVCDLGASFIHGHKNSKIYELAKKQGVKLVKFDYDDATVIVDQKKVDAEDFLDKVWAWEDILENMRKKFKGALNDNSNLKELVEMAKTEKKIDANTALHLNVFLRTDVEAEYGAMVDKLSAKYFDYADVNDGDDWVFPNGYMELFNPIAKTLNIKLNQIVQNIIQEDDLVLINTADGQNFQAQYCICTVPLGCLKKKLINFEPPLSEGKERAIEKMGFGTLDKVFLVFDHVFWEDTSVLILVRKNPLNPIMYVANMNKVFGVPALMLFVPQSFASQTNTNSQAIEEARNILAYSYPHAQFNIVASYATNWGSDKFTHGAYSSFAPGTTLTDHEELAKPEGKRVYFAGEHTVGDNMSTVEGAYTSGLTAAADVSKGLKSIEKVPILLLSA